MNAGMPENGKKKEEVQEKSENRTQERRRIVKRGQGSVAEKLKRHAGVQKNTKKGT